METQSVNIFIKTLGCKVNLFDSNVIASRLKEVKLEGVSINLVSDFEQAHCVIINTCSVTHNAEKEVFYLVRHYRKYNPQIKIVLTGCAVSIEEVKERLETQYGVDLVVLNKDKSRFLSWFIPFMYSWLNLDCLPETENNYSLLDGPNGRTDILFGEGLSERQRYFLKIQDGCNAMCSYCIIPYTRGKPRSVEESLVLDQVKKVVDSGIQEIVFTGIHVGKYGLDCGSNLLDLLTKVSKIKPYFRYRISSIEVGELNSELLNFLKDSTNFCHHFHIPLQSGSDKILSSMNRKYTREEFKSKLAQIRELFEDACIGSDVIVGFCGEDEKDFKDTVDLIETSSLNYLHVFPYSPRKGTASYKLADTNQNIKIERAKTLRELSRHLWDKYLDENIDKKCELLWESEHEGCSKNYIHVYDTKNHVPGTISESVFKSKDPYRPSVMRIFE